MHIRIDASALRAALTRVKAGLSSSDYHSTHPYVVLHAQGEQLVLCTWKSAFRIDARVPCEVEQEGSFAVSHQQLLQATNPLRGTLSLRREGLEILVSPATATGSFVLPIGGEEVGKVQTCPIVSAVKEGLTYTRQENQGITCEACKVTRTERHVLTYRIERVITQLARLPKAHLLQLLRKVNWLPEYYCRRPELEGVCLEVASGRVSLIGADVNGVAIASTALREEEACDWERRVLVNSALFTKALRPLPPAEVCLEAVLTRHRLIQRDGEPVADTEPFERPVFLRLTAGQFSVTIPLMDLPIPDYRALMPTAWVTRLTCGTAALNNALQALTSVDATVEWHLAKASLVLEVQHKPAPARHEVQLIEQEGPDAHPICNAAYLLCALNQITAPRVALEIYGDERPIVLRPVESGDVQYVLALQSMKKAG